MDGWVGGLKERWMVRRNDGWSEGMMDGQKE